MEKQLLIEGLLPPSTNKLRKSTHGISRMSKFVQDWRCEGPTTSQAEAEEESFIAIIGLICHYEKLKCENLRPWKLKIQT